jgi:hypothetical protein
MWGVPSESVIKVKSHMHLPEAMLLQFSTLDQDSMQQEPTQNTTMCLSSWSTSSVFLQYECIWHFHGEMLPELSFAAERERAHCYACFKQSWKRLGRCLSLSVFFLPSKSCQVKHCSPYFFTMSPTLNKYSGFCSSLRFTVFLSS